MQSLLLADSDCQLKTHDSKGFPSEKQEDNFLTALGIVQNISAPAESIYQSFLKTYFKPA
jgi:hypothetical protein